MTILAIDAGTDAVTAVVVDGRGGIVATASRPVDRHVPRPGWVEQAPEEIWQATLGAVRAVLTEAEPGQLEALGITSRREAVLLWDSETLGSPRRAISGEDRRTTELSDRLRAAGHEQRVVELTGRGLDPRSPATKLAWLAEHEPHTWALVESGRYAIGTVDSYLATRMTRGTYHVTDVSTACRTQLLDLATGDWSDELCSLFGVPREALPELVPTWGEIAVTDARSVLGLSLPISGLAGDQQSALFGQARFGEGDSACTYDVVTTVLTNAGATLPRSAPGVLPTAAWRSPDGQLTYALEGSARATDARVAPEVVAAEVRDLLEASSSRGALRVGGAAVADDRFCQVQADRIGAPVERPRTLQTAALGAAFLAGLGTGAWSSPDDLRDTWTLDRRFEPGAGGRPSVRGPS